jgi:D-tyrosyl-tRNA(Tyr) deacylase
MAKRLSVEIARYRIPHVMRVIVQRVTEAQVNAGGKMVGKIARGMCVFLGVGKGDSETNASALAEKVRNVLIFEDEDGKMNRSVIDVQGDLLVVSQFTLYADCSKGYRPSFSDAAPAAEAEALYNFFVDRLRGFGLKVATGKFQAKMEVSVINDGPATLFLQI